MRKYQTVENIELPADVPVQQRCAPIAGDLRAYLQSANQDQHKGLEGESEDTESSIAVLSHQYLVSLDVARLVVQSTEEKARKKADLETAIVKSANRLRNIRIKAGCTRIVRMSQPFSPQRLESDREECISGMERKDDNGIWLSTQADSHFRPSVSWDEQ